VTGQRVAIVHDYLTQRGGAERVVLSMLRAFPGAQVHTSLYDDDSTFPEFRAADIQTLALDRVGPLRRAHRLAFPLLAPAFQRHRVDADVAICSSSGWAHGVRAAGKKMVYCHAPARWLYQTDRYLAGHGAATRGVTHALRRPLLRWDLRAARSADLYVVNSRAVQQQVRAVYGFDAEVVPPPPAIDHSGPRSSIGGIVPGFFLCVARLLPYKNVGAVVAAFSRLPDLRLVIVGTGPQELELRRLAGANVHFCGGVQDDEIRWLYANCRAAVAASYEDFGLTPLEAAVFGKPTAALRYGGFLDTIVDGETGVFFNRPEPSEIASAVRRIDSAELSPEGLQTHAARFGEDRFARRITELAEALVA